MSIAPPAAAADIPAPGGPAEPAVLSYVPRGRSEFLYFALRNKKLMFGLGLEAVFVLAAVIGPMISPHDPNGIFLPAQAPSAQHWLGTDNYIGRDVFAELVWGLRDSYLVGALGALFAAAIGMAIGFTAGYRGGIIDEVLQMLTNFIVIIPSLVLMIVIDSYLKNHGAFFEGVFIGVTTWPWVARAVRAQTFTLRNRDYVDLARLSGRRAWKIVLADIAPNMASYLFLTVVLLFGSAMLIAASYDFLGLGPTTGSLGTMLGNAFSSAALQLHIWWFFVTPGVALTGMVAALLIANVGLDEVFNPKLREL